MAATTTALGHADAPPPPVRHEEPVAAPRTQGDDNVTSYTDTPYLALRVLPIELAAGIGLAGVEVKILPNLTVVSQLGLGRVKVRHFDAELNEVSSERKTYVSLDLQGRYYMVGLLSAGLYVSADVNYAWFDSDQLINSPLINLASGMRAGGSFGGTYTSTLGLGVDMQFLLHGRVYRPTFTEVSPAEVRPGPVAFGVSIALTYVF